MKRFYRLDVDRLEDRWVPSTVTDTGDVGSTQVVVTDDSSDPAGGIDSTTVPTDTTQYVINVPPTDPNAPPTDPGGQLGDPTAPDGGGGDGGVSNPVDIAPPIDDPYWY